MFWKNFRRELIFTTSRLVSVVVIAAVAVLMFVALSGNTYNAERIAQQYFKEQNVADLWVTGVGFDRADFRNVSKIDGIKDVQPRTTIDAESRDFAGEIRHAVGLSGADGDVSSQFPLLPLELLLRLFRQLHNLLGPAAQEHPVVSEGHMVFAAAKELHAQLLLQPHQLAG